MGKKVKRKVKKKSLSVTILAIAMAILTLIVFRTLDGLDEIDLDGAFAEPWDDIDD